MAFRFSLASVLLVRDSIERREELALQRVQFEIAQITQRIKVISDQIDSKRDERNRALRQPIQANQLLAIISEINAPIEARQALVNSLATLEQEREKCTKAYWAAHADRQMLTDMLTQQRTSYDLEQDRKQQKLLDEIYTARSSRT